MPKNHFSRAKKVPQGVLMGVLGVVWISKSGLGILIQAPEVPFVVPSKRPKTAKTAHFCRFEGTKNGTSGARIKIPRPLLEIQTTPKTPN